MSVNQQRIEIIGMHQRGGTISDISRQLHADKATVSKTIKRFNELGTFEDRKRSGRPKTARTRPIIRSIQKKIRQDSKKERTRSKRQMAREEGISEGSVRKIVKEDLQSKSYKKQKAHFLTEDMMKVRKQRCQTLLRRFQNATHRSIVFSDEKWFSVEEKFNKQNHRVIAKNIEEANKKGRIVKKQAHPKSTMVWAAITSDGKSPLVFIEKGVKVRGQNYREMLKKHLKPWARRHFGARWWCFQQVFDHLFQN